MTRRQMLFYLLIGMSLGLLLGTAVAFSSPVFRTTIGQLFLKKEETEPIEEFVQEHHRDKSDSEKVDQMMLDAETMSNLYLYYNYDKLSLVDTVKAYLNEFGIDEDAVTFAYRPIAYDEAVDYQSNQLISIGVMDIIPINLYLNELLDDAEKDENAVSESQYYSLAYQDVSSTLYLASLVGGLDEVYSILERYGNASNEEIPTMDLNRDQTTVDYLRQLMDYMWKHQEKFASIFDILLETYQGRYLDTFLPTERVLQYPSDDGSGMIQLTSIVYEDTPYVVALATDGLSEYEVAQLGYVINEWHRVNMN